MRDTFRLHQLALIGAILALALGVHATAADYKGLETPAYEVVSRDGPVELRRYAPHLVAEVDVEGTRGQAIRKGFRILAGFIFGDNAEGQAVAMTAPVSQWQEKDHWTIRFAMPREFTRESLPAPENGAIRLVETGESRVLALRFAGRATESVLAEKGAILRAYAKAHGHRVTGQLHYHFYDDPFTLPRNRRNEVSLPVS